MSILPRRPDGRPSPADPTKPFSRTKRRVLFYLSRGGRLRKQLCRDKKDHKIFSRDPERCFWLLEPMPEVVWRGNLVRERRITKEIIDDLQLRGYLRVRFAEPDEITKVDLKISDSELQDLFSRTDWNGNWIKPSLAAIVEQARSEGHERRRA